jgi:hypothetical protein
MQKRWGTNAECVTDTLAWFPTNIVMPRHSSMDSVIDAVHGLTHSLVHPSPASPLMTLADSHHQQLLQLADIFQQHTQRLDRVPTDPPTELPSLVPAPSNVPIITPSPIWDISYPTTELSTAPAPIPRVVPTATTLPAPMVAPKSPTLLPSCNPHTHRHRLHHRKNTPTKAMPNIY